MEQKNGLEISLIPYDHSAIGTNFDLDQIIYDLDNQIELLSSQADTLDYLISVASGILCGMLDILWVGEFSLEYGREIGSDKVEAFVKKAERDLEKTNTVSVKEWQQQTVVAFWQAVALKVARN